jgi:hypothetical protein
MQKKKTQKSYLTEGDYDAAMTAAIELRSNKMPKENKIMSIY